MRSLFSSGARFEIVSDHPDQPLIIRDVGPWTEYPTVTNDAERVVLQLLARNLLPAGRRLLYYDSAGNLDELRIKNGAFAGFAFGLPSPSTLEPSHD